MDSFGSSVMAIGAGLGAAFGVKELAGWVKGAMDASDATHDMAERLGMGTESLQKLGYVAKVSGVDQETLTGSLEKMNVRLGEVATEGSGPAADALRHFGLSARELATENPAESFKTLIGVIGEIPNPAERAKVAVDLFGKSGQAMVQIASQGKEGIAALEREFVALGGGINAVNAEKIGEANDAIDRASIAVGALANNLAVELSPLITYVADSFVDWAKEGGRAGSIVSQGIDFVTDAAGLLGDGVQVLEAAFYGWQSVVMTVLSKISQGIGAILKDLDGIAHSGALRALAPELEIVWNLMGDGQKKALTESSSFFESWSEGLAAEAAKSGQAAAEAWDKPWAHDRVRAFIDNIQFEAGKRAQLSAGKEHAFAGGGALTKSPGEGKELQFGGALEIGSKEAYSSILKSRSMLMSAGNGKLEASARTTADATTRTAVATAKMAELLGKRLGGDLGREMSGAA